MNSYVNVLLQALLSWVRVVAQWVWDTLLGGNGGLIVWIGENWLMLTITLCVVGMAVDAVIHLLRWRWDLVWASFFRRMRRKRTGSPAAQMVMEDSEAEAIRPAEDDQAYETPLAWREPDTWSYEETTAPAPSSGEPVPEPREDMQPARPALGGRLRDLAGRLLASPIDGEGLPEHYQTPSLPVDREQAYGQPYIPPQWRRPEEYPTEDDQQ